MTDVAVPVSTPQPVTIHYTNWQGKTAYRRIMPLRIWFGTNAWHHGNQWFLDARDLDKDEDRSFALSSIHSWVPSKALTP